MTGGHFACCTPRGASRRVVDAERLDALRARLDLSISFLLREGPLPRRGPVLSHIRELLAGIRPDTAVAMLCGPARMMEIAADALLAAGMLPDAIHYERFDLAAGKGSWTIAACVRRCRCSLALLVLMGLFSVRGP
jgi:ferredoxin-NADP reductase